MDAPGVVLIDVLRRKGGRIPVDAPMLWIIDGGLLPKATEIDLAAARLVIALGTTDEALRRRDLGLRADSPVAFSPLCGQDSRQRDLCGQDCCSTHCRSAAAQQATVSAPSTTRHTLHARACRTFCLFETQIASLLSLSFRALAQSPVSNHYRILCPVITVRLRL